MFRTKKELKEEITARLSAEFPLTAAELELTSTPDQKLGDLALSIAFPLAKKLKTSPRTIAARAAELLSGIEGLSRVEVAGAGYINLYLDREKFFRKKLASQKRTGLEPEEKKIIVEHTNINPNKAAHVGHLRNACLGDTLVRCLRYRGEKVEVQNYIDDTGVQVVDVVFGLMELEKKSLADLDRIDGKFDYYCWDLYTRVSRYLAENQEAQARKSAILKKIEHGESPEADYAHLVSRRILRAHLATMKRLDIGYDVLPCESSILRLKFWEKAFARLRESGAIHLSSEGENAGCWVMKLEDEPEREKIIVRSDGTVTYVGKDIAYQMWKFGLLGQDFYYEPFLQDNGRQVWISSATPTAYDVHFGAGSKVYNVIDVRQSYLQKVVVQGLKSLGYLEQAEKSIHFSYEMVALSPGSLAEIKVDLTEEDRDRAFLEVSGRKGVGIKADDLLDRLEEKALAEVNKRNPDLPEASRREIARQIASSAVRYFMLKYARNSLIVFDFDEALNFEGETGPYLQYTAVRLRSIFRKFQERFGISGQEFLGRVDPETIRLSGLPEEEARDFWDLVVYACGLDEEVLRAIATLEFAGLAKFTFNLCQKFNSYYHHYPVLAEKDPNRQTLRLLTIHFIHEILCKALDLMGIRVPDKM
ncbi:MAG: Arginyl-tRNA synthetase [Candidatus Saccharicenans subterraneus]|uniref:arginine--tRNA ligase n=1 Tax=Candidatus Saccharicenans subterraneus TaxID=2508984 RepID=A0A3E2BJA7_9BACT|nr:MAG: Arginyl-tRNA synthetase [Candidatus Saccharicenans subterraneum]